LTPQGFAWEKYGEITQSPEAKWDKYTSLLFLRALANIENHLCNKKSFRIGTPIFQKSPYLKNLTLPNT